MLIELLTCHFGTLEFFDVAILTRQQIPLCHFDT
jgi:hypothetical protein